MIVTNFSDCDVTVRLGNGNGTFTTEQTHYAGGYPVAFAMADFNGDGTPDIAVLNQDANIDTNYVSVLTGEGYGNFSWSNTKYTVGNTPVALAAGDLNGDGTQDIVVANQADNDVSVLMGNGDGTFQTQQTYAVGAGPSSVALADLNNDGILDIVVANSASNTVSVLTGNGNGTFHTQQTYAVGCDPTSVALADINNDGIPDIIVANSVSNTVSVLMGNANGTFQTQTTYAVGSDPTSVALADINGDGKPDVVVANGNSNTLSVLLGSGNGTFQAQKTFAVGSDPNSVAAGDLNGDGRLDLVTANTFSVTASVLMATSTFTGQTYTVDTPAQLAFTQQPTNVQAGVAISPPVTVAVEDSTGATIGADSSLVTLTLSSGTFAGGGSTATVAAVNGVATFSNLIIDSVGNYTLTASDGALTGAASGSFTVT